MRRAAILAAAGPGSRLAAGQPKAFVELAGEPLFLHSLRALTQVPWTAIAIIVPEGFEAVCQRHLARLASPACHLRIGTGGATRQDSVRAGLRLVTDSELVAVHDAARPFIDAATIQEVVRCAESQGAAVVATPASDTVKIAGAKGQIESTPPRERVWLAQTPQVFHRELLERAHADAAQHGINGTDDAALVERLGVPVHVVPARRENRKITTPDDLRWAEWVLASTPR